MSDRAYLATRKGLFEIYRTHEAWHLDQQHFLGDPVTMVLPDRRDGTLYAALNLGHFGTKLHRRDPGSDTWVEVAAPAFPLKPEDSTDPVEWKVRQIWSMAAGTATPCESDSVNVRSSTPRTGREKVTFGTVSWKTRLASGAG